MHTALKDVQAGAGALSSPHLGPTLACLKLRCCALPPPGLSPVCTSVGSCPVSRKSQRWLHFCDSTRVIQ